MSTKLEYERLVATPETFDMLLDLEADPAELVLLLLNVALNQVLQNGFHCRTRPLSARAQANRRLPTRIQALHAGSDGVLGRRRIGDDLRDEGEICSVKRVGRLMSGAGLQGILQRKRWRRKPSGKRPAPVCNHLERDFQAPAPNSKWVTDITYGAPS